MSFLKNKLVLVVILAILAGGITGLYLSKMKKADQPNVSVVNTGTGTPTPEKVGEVIQKLKGLTND